MKQYEKQYGNAEKEVKFKICETSCPAASSHNTTNFWMQLLKAGLYLGNAGASL